MSPKVLAGIACVFVSSAPVFLLPDSLEAQLAGWRAAVHLCLQTQRASSALAQCLSCWRLSQGPK